MKKTASGAGKAVWKHREEILTVAGIGACVASVVACGVVTAVSVGNSVGTSFMNQKKRGQGFARSLAAGVGAGTSIILQVSLEEN